MPDENLVKYIRNELAMGRTEDVLRPLLLNGGWVQEDIDQAFAFVKSGQASPSAGMPAAAPKENASLEPRPLRVEQPQQARSSAAAQSGANGGAFALMQTKSNLWAATRIWTVEALVIFVFTFLYLLASYSAAAFASIPAPWFSAASPVLVFGLTIFAVWLGVRSVRRVTSIDPGNVLAASLLSALIPAALQIASFAFGILSGNVYLLALSFVAQNGLIFLLVYYWLSDRARFGRACLAFIVFFFVVSLAQAYFAWSQGAQALTLIPNPAQKNPEVAQIEKTEKGLMQGKLDISNGNTLVMQTTTYVNTAQDFSLVVPPGWYIPASDALPAELYDCPTTQCDALIEFSVGGSVIPGNPATNIASDIQEDGSSVLSHQTIDNLVPDARIVKSIQNPTDNPSDPIYGTIWTYGYTVYWPYPIVAADGSEQSGTFEIYLQATNATATEALLPGLKIAGAPMD